MSASRRGGDAGEEAVRAASAGDGVVGDGAPDARARGGGSGEDLARAASVGDGVVRDGAPYARARGGGPPGAVWTGERAERHLRSLELFGMRFGLDRTRRMMTALGSPQRRFAAVHVLGTNGKTSTTRMLAAILERHGLRTGAYLSPHLRAYPERIQVGEQDLSTSAFAAAVARAAWAAERVNRTLAADDHVTQFELLTAAALWVLAERGVEVAVVEAGLGGRYDATAVVESRVTVLTTVGLEHTRWLGPTVHDIAAEKLAVVRPGATLALGADLHPDALARARAVAAERGARIVQVTPVELARVPALGSDTWTSLGHSALAPAALAPSVLAPSAPAPPALAPPALAPPFQRRNFALARLAAEAHLANAGIAVREAAVREAALAATVPGRLQVVGDDPLTVLDGAHNPDAARALVEALRQSLRGVRLALVMGVLEDKDAASMLRALLPLCARAWFTAPPSRRALSPAALQSLARQLGFAEANSEPSPRRALQLAQDWAGVQTEPTVVLATGSIYLVGDLLTYLAERGDHLSRAVITGDAGGGGAGEDAASGRAAADGTNRGRA